MEGHTSQRKGKEILIVPSLVDLCVKTAIDNIEDLGDVGVTDSKFLIQILPHCTVDQLKYIEDSTDERDLSPMTDHLWENFYKKNFGEKSFNEVVHKLKSRNLTFSWKKLYEAKLMDVEEAQQRSNKRMKQFHNGEGSSTQIC